ncbi:thioredoxin reductase (NADPH) [Luteococcus japonicus]|uniref:Thioredoxin reductase n=2 Tax=Luteococcus japonicus TaxID=33984 RepID=A0A1R4J8Y4_9ACTN|nr:MULTISPECIES: thioredoxin-disulfide reductase [Luteococcus]MDN5563270.1 thioredoxin-disulfide reductase [Luteococcus sp.]ROR54844.1 thioredoxin reductase (NADPH) [Luteococcus japonicus]SJN28364.1 Thioredoxin reductase [Luteococcus japonicus LSP_Lj1]
MTTPALNVTGLISLDDITPDEQPATPATQEDSAVREVIIVGSGPAGYTAAIYTARAGLEPLVIEGAFSAGGALMNTTEVENYPGYTDGIMGPDLMKNMRGQAERFGAELITDDAEELDLTGPIKTVTDSAGNTYRAKSVILATGSGYKRLGLADEDKYSGRGVSWCATCDGFFFKDKPIVVVGGGDSAVEEATFLSRFGSTVTMVVRRDELRASKIMAARAMNDPKITIEWNSNVVSMAGEPALETVTIENNKTGEQKELPVNGLFVAIGHDPRSELVKGQVELDAAGYVLTEPDGTKTNLSGVFACGDLVDHTYRQAITAAGSGCKAALDAERFLADLADENVQA